MEYQSFLCPIASGMKWETVVVPRSENICGQGWEYKTLLGILFITILTPERVLTNLGAASLLGMRWDMDFTSGEQST